MAESLCDFRTIRKAYAARPISQTSRSRIRMAAERLGLPPPPDPINPHATFRAGLPEGKAAGPRE